MAKRTRHSPAHESYIGDAAPAKAAPEAKRPTIWHVIDWEREFEPDDAYRRGQKSPLRYVKLHIRREHEDGQQVELRRRILLDQGQGGREAWAVFTLLCIAAGDRPDHRGYLWNHRGLPATDREIGVLIGVPTSVVTRALALLEGEYMERVECPVERYVPPPTPRSEDGRAVPSRMRDGSTPPAAVNGAGAPSAGGGESPGQIGLSADRRPPAADGRPQEDEIEGRNRVSCGPSSAAGGVTATVTATPTDTETATANGNGQGAAERSGSASASAGGGAGEGGTETETATETTMPTPTACSRAPDGACAGGAGQVVPRPALPTEADPGVTRRAVAGPLTALAASPDGVAARIYLALYPHGGAVLANARRGGPGGQPREVVHFETAEIGAIGSVWQDAISAGKADEYAVCKAIRMAEKIAKRRRPARKTNGALWTWEFRHWLAAQPRRVLPPATGPPG